MRKFPFFRPLVIPMRRVRGFLRFQRNLFKFQVERFIVRGPFHRLFVIIVGIALISFGAGLLVFYTVGGFGSPGEAVWWAFLRLTDPGYLGDDRGVGLRTVSTFLTVLGYVIFLGALVAIMTQWLNETLNRWQSGFTPIAQRGHIVILGWTHQTPIIVQELIGSEGQVKRFLRRRGARQRLHIAILAEEVRPALVQELKELLGPHWNPRQIILRSGTPLRTEHLRRVDALHAAAIMVPAGEFRPEVAELTDARAIKVLLAIEHSSRHRTVEEKPRIVTELFDARKAPIARQAYAGQMEILASDLTISRLMAQMVRHSGLSRVYSELLAYTEGTEMYVRECPECAGRTWNELAMLFEKAIPIGIARYMEAGYETVLNPDPAVRLQPDDRIVFLAQDYESTQRFRARQRQGQRDAPEAPQETVPVPQEAPRNRRILLLGWNRRTPALLQEFDTVPYEQFELDILSEVPVQDRLKEIRQYDVQLQDSAVQHIEGDYTFRSDLVAIRPDQYDHIVLLASDWSASEIESDARTVLGFLILQDVLADKARRPHILVELMDPGNETLLEHYPHEALVTPVILSHLLTHITLRRELRSVFDVLLGPKGPEIAFRPVEQYGLDRVPFSFAQIQRVVARTGEVALGLHLMNDETNTPDERILLNPDRQTRWWLTSQDAFIVLTKGPAGGTKG